MLSTKKGVGIIHCVITKRNSKTTNSYGYPKELHPFKKEVLEIIGMKQTIHTYKFSEEVFERQGKNPYQIVIVESFREEGILKKNRWTICTLDYYTLAEHTLTECLSDAIAKKAKTIGLTEEEIFEKIRIKLEPIANQIKEEFQKTEEYKTHLAHQKILNKHRLRKQKFEANYGENTYELCYDIYGVLQNQSYLELFQKQKEMEEVEKERKQARQKEQEKRSKRSEEERKSRFQQAFGSFLVQKGTYTEEEREKLRKIYRVAAKKFHPDASGDNGEMMMFLTKLKEEWGI